MPRSRRGPAAGLGWAPQIDGRTAPSGAAAAGCSALEGGAGTSRARESPGASKVSWGQRVNFALLHSMHAAAPSCPAPANLH